MAGRRRGRWIFRPGAIPTLATAALLPLLLALGHWQLDRAAEKTALQEQATARARMPPLAIAPAGAAWGDAAALAGRRVVLRGRWQPARQILLDNRVFQGQAGYQVFTPLRMAGTTDAVLVDRGWVVAGARRETAPDVALAAAEVEVEGIAAPPPSPGWGAGSDADASLGAGLLRVQRVDPAELSAGLGLRLAPWTLRLSPAAPDGYAREWPAAGFQPERHRAYALQWFLLAAVLAGLYVGLNLRRTLPGESR